MLGKVSYVCLLISAVLWYSLSNTLMMVISLVLPLMMYALSLACAYISVRPYRKQFASTVNMMKAMGASQEEIQAFMIASREEEDALSDDSLVPPWIPLFLKVSVIAGYVVLIVAVIQRFG